MPRGKKNVTSEKVVPTEPMKTDEPVVAEPPVVTPPEVTTVVPDKVVNVKKSSTKRSKKETEIVKPIKKKRAPSSYVLFTMKHRNVVIAENPDLKLGEVSKKCGEAWSQLSDEEKAKWKAESDIVKKKLEENQAPEEPTKVVKKRGPSAYLLFAMAQRDSIIKEEPNLKLGDVSKKCGLLWRNLSEEEKNVWKQKTSSSNTEMEVS